VLFQAFKDAGYDPGSNLIIEWGVTDRTLQRRLAEAGIRPTSSG